MSIPEIEHDTPNSFRVSLSKKPLHSAWLFTLNAGAKLVFLCFWFIPRVLNLYFETGESLSLSQALLIVGTHIPTAFTCEMALIPDGKTQQLMSFSIVSLERALQYNPKDAHARLGPERSET